MEILIVSFVIAVIPVSLTILALTVREIIIELDRGN